MFLKHIDDTYFDGEMDLDSKEMLKADLAENNGGGDGGAERKVTIFNADDATGTSPPLVKRTVYFTN